jgi:hypothetical protein
VEGFGQGDQRRVREVHRYLGVGLHERKAAPAQDARKFGISMSRDRTGAASAADRATRPLAPGATAPR